MSISAEQVRWVATLARLELSDDELSHMTEQLSAILDYVDQLKQVPTDGVEPLAHPLDIHNVFRAPTFSGLPGTDDKDHSLADYKKDVVVIVVTCNHCPVATAYEDRIVELSKKYADKVDLVAINVNTIEADRMSKMKERAKAKGFAFPYLYDQSQ